MVIQKQRHCCSGTDGSVSDLEWVEAKTLRPSIGAADLPEEFLAEILSDEPGSSSYFVEGAQQSIVIPTFHKFQYSLYCSSQTEHGAQTGISCFHLSACVIFLSILLILKHDPNKGGMVQELRVIMRDQIAVLGVETDSSQSYIHCLAL